MSASSSLALFFLKEHTQPQGRLSFPPQILNTAIFSLYIKGVNYYEFA